MIGVIGPSDSVRLVLAVAAEEGRADEVIGRTYRRPDQAAEIAVELDGLCKVILFTGRVPYLHATTNTTLTAQTQFISHSGDDLYRAIAQILIDRQGVMPRVSVDTLDTETANAAFADLDLAAPVDVFAMVWDELGGDGVEPVRSVATAKQITAQHRARFEAGEVDLCLTCLASTRELLRRSGVPVHRIDHTHLSVRDALHNAWLSAELVQSRATQLAVAIISALPADAVRLDSHGRERARLAVHHALLDQTKKLSGRLSSVDENTYVITTNRGAVESAILRAEARQSSLLNLPDLESTLTVGIGIGESYALAEDHARRALQLAELSRVPTVVYPDGAVKTAAGGVSSLRLLETTPAMLDLAERIGIGPLSIRRLIDALGQLDAASVTSSSLARAYGVQHRSARRLLTALAAAGLADEAGVSAGPGAGRPQTVYRVDIRAMLRSLLP